MENNFVTADMIRFEQYTLLEKLPDPFIAKNGQRLTDPAAWADRRCEIADTACTLLYGVRPPEPEFLEVEPICDYYYSRTKVYRITTGTRERPLSFRLKLLIPENTEGKWPVIIDGDDCFRPQEGYYEAALSRGIGWALFDRTEFAHDVQSEQRGCGALYETYPELDCGALSCWAWGYSRAADALQKLDLPIDLDWIAITGHSRGGKTTLLAGAMDERFRVVNPNESGAGGCGCYRVQIRGVYNNEVEGRNEVLRDSMEAFPYWYGKAAAAYVDRENELPFDLHFIKAMVAPRTLFVSEAAGDLWANPPGSWQTTMAAKEVYRFLNAEENLFWYYRPGYHAHLACDAQMLVNVILHQKNGEPLDERMFRVPFAEPVPAFDWRCPGTGTKP
ncbi:MAG: hypothetical protein IJ412_11640 [Oscillospiraceae bacterium]|nr:hypothetical protein [Oscillospiraceae bacterium]